MCKISASLEEGLEVLVSEVTKANTCLQCYECKAEILSNNMFNLDVYLLDDTPQVHITCADCYSIRCHLFSDYYYGYLWSNLYGSLIDDLENINWSNIPHLTKTAKESIFEAVETAWDYLEANPNLVKLSTNIYINYVD